MNENDPFRADIERVQRRAWIGGGVAVAVCLAGAFFNADQFFRSYLLGLLLWTGVAMGCFAILMLHHLVSGDWGFVVQRILEAGTRTLPLTVLLWLPLMVFGLPRLYVWARPEVVAASEILQHKRAYLNLPFFVSREIFFAGVWIALILVVNRWSAEHDRTGDPVFPRRLQSIAGPGLVIYALTMSLFAFDWIMSLQPLWYSTAFGLLTLAAQGLSAMAFTIIALAFLSRGKPLAGIVTPAHFHDLGNLQLMFVMLWSYIAFSQFLIIWSGNLPKEISWYFGRLTTGWAWIGLLLVLFHFAVPFVLLLMREIKRTRWMLASLAAGLLLVRWLDIFWLVEPSYHADQFFIHWMDLVLPVGIGGIWIAVFISELKKRPLLPVHHPLKAGVLEPAEET